MSQENKDIVRRFLTELQNDKRMAVVDELVAEDFIGHSAELKGPQELKDVVQDNLSAFPDLHVTIEDQISEGDKVVTRSIAQGTQLGTYRGVPPTGKPVTYVVVNIHRLRDGKIIEGWRVVDRLDIAHQLGAVY